MGVVRVEGNREGTAWRPFPPANLAQRPVPPPVGTPPAVPPPVGPAVPPAPPPPPVAMLPRKATFIRLSEFITGLMPGTLPLLIVTSAGSCTHTWKSIGLPQLRAVRYFWTDATRREFSSCAAPQWRSGQHGS